MIKEKKDFKEYGYTIYRNVFNAVEINNFRNQVKLSLDQDLKYDRAEFIEISKKSVYYTHGDIMTKPISELLFDKRIIGIAKEILSETPCYFGEGNYQVGVGDRGYHRDSVEEIIDGKSTRIYGHGPDWNDDYKIIRIGVYLQDHDKYSGGVKFQEGSNKLPYNKGRSVLADTKAGDVVVWDLRTYHSGNSVRMKLFPNLSLPRRVEDFLPDFLTISEPMERNSVFMVFGADNKHLVRHIDKHYKIKFKKHISLSIYSDSIIEKAKKAGIKFIKLI
jgi:hypothetical protein